MVIEWNIRYNYHINRLFGKLEQLFKGNLQMLSANLKGGSVMVPENKEYFELIDSIKTRIKAAQYKALLHANEELIGLYWSIGNDLIRNVQYGSKFIDNLARDIKIAMPNIKGYSARNLRYMKRFAKEITDQEFLQTVSAKLPWSHNIVLIEQLLSMEERYWYGYKTIENGWSVAVLEHQIATKLFDRQEQSTKIHNFDRQLPDQQSELVIETMKDPYIFDFIEFDEDMVELDIENELVKRITSLLLELGTGFAYVGHQYSLYLDGEEFILDMLFYNIKLHCYVVIDLKTKKFTPEHAGKMNFYLSLVDDQLKSDKDAPSIGLILCRNRNKVVAEYALRDMNKPIGVSEYKFIQELPEEYKEALPDINELVDSMIKVKKR
jgi:predicted nuclease of restriction endonuclease-like (RecB) superfamily